LIISFCAAETLIITLEAVIARIITVIIRKTFIRIDIFLPLYIYYLYNIPDFVKKIKSFRHNIELKTGPDDAGRRLDRVLRKALPDHSLSLIHRLLRQGKVLLDGKPADPGDRVQPDSVIQVVLRVRNEELGMRNGEDGGKSPPPLQSCGLPLPPSAGDTPATPPPYSLTPHSSLLTPHSLTLWRGSGIIVLNKPPGLATHGENSLDTLVNAWLAGTLPDSLSFKPGPLHRLDKPTSGAIVFSETIEGARLFSRLLRERKAVKTYLAIVEGHLTGEQVWQDELARNAALRKTFAGGEAGAKNALTVVKALASNGSYTLLQARIETGRTHQIRAQAASRGHPLAGDAKYGGHRFPGGFYLHAWKLELGGHIAGFPQPLTAPLPYPFRSCITALFGTNLLRPLTEARGTRRRMRSEE
jgi:23S rRNA pseudouridine955/2504/2580 synthase